MPINWRPQSIKYDNTELPMSGSAGLEFITDLFYDDPLFEEFKNCLPERRSNASYDSELFAMTTILSIIEGHDCIEDIASFENDPFVMKTLGGENLNNFLRTFSRRARKQVAPGEPLIIDIDSTHDVQRGLKMEGVQWNYMKKWSLDSLPAWDELGRVLRSPHIAILLERTRLGREQLQAGFPGNIHLKN